MPYFILMKPTPWKSLMQFGNSVMTLKPVCFTLDAGANVHVLYPENDSEKVLQFIKDSWLCQNGHL
jgi:diphosphomevalonate decarboxylase